MLKVFGFYYEVFNKVGVSWKMHQQNNTKGILRISFPTADEFKFMDREMENEECTSGTPTHKVTKIFHCLSLLLALSCVPHKSKFNHYWSQNDGTLTIIAWLPHKNEDTSKLDTSKLEWADLSCIYCITITANQSFMYIFVISSSYSQGIIYFQWNETIVTRMCGAVRRGVGEV